MENGKKPSMNDYVNDLRDERAKNFLNLNRRVTFLYAIVFLFLFVTFGIIIYIWRG